MDPDDCTHLENCLCEHCRRRQGIGLSPLRFYAAADVRTTSKRLAKQVNADQKRLSVLWTKLGPTAISTWRGKRSRKREDMLKDFVPRRRPELELRTDAMLSPTTKQAFLFPHMNAEDLAHEDNVLTLFKARAMSEPRRFATFDLQNASIPLVGHDERPDSQFSDHAMLLSTDGSNEYGSIAAGSTADNKTRFCVDIGLLILQIQARLYALLVKLLEAVTGRKRSELSHATLREMIDADFSLVDVSEEVDGSGSLQAAIAQTPFCIPPEPDFDLLEELVTSKKDAAIQHVVNLRENPPYFRECMRKWADHLTSDRKHRNFAISRWLLVHHAYQMVWLWHAVQTTLRHLKGLQVIAGEDLRRFQALRNALDDLAVFGCRYFEEGIPVAEKFTKHLVKLTGKKKTCTSSDDHEMINNYTTKPGASEYAARLFGLFSSLCLDDCHVVGLHNLTGEIEKMLTQRKRSHLFVDDWIDESFSHLLAVTQVQAQLQLWQSRVSVPKEIIAEELFRKQEREEYNQTLMDSLNVYCHLRPLSPDEPQLLCLDGPTNDISAKAQQRKASTYLEHWWRQLDIDLKWLSDDGESRRILGLDGEPLSDAWVIILDAVDEMEPLWQLEGSVNEAGKEHSSLLACEHGRDGATDAIATAAKGIAGLSLRGTGSSEPTTGRNILKEAAKNKDKRQTQAPATPVVFGPPRPPYLLAAQPVQAAQQHDEEKTISRIRVGKKALAIWGMVLGHGRNGQIDFKAIQQGMDAAGFDSRQLASSAFWFRHREKKLSSIQFHINHGTQDSKIGKTTLTNMARRLKRAYGWSAETFVLDKDKEE